jgi:hypothetical protein
MFWNPDDNLCGPVSASLLEEVIGLIPPHLPLWVRITGKTPEQTTHICRQLERVCRRLQYQGPLAWVDLPLFYHSNRGLPQHYSSLLAETEFCLIAENNPQLIGAIAGKTKRKNIRTAVLKSLAKERRFCGLLFKGDLNRSLNYHRALRSRHYFPTYDASEHSFLDKPSLSGVVSIGTNILPNEWRTVAQSSVSLNERHEIQAGRFRHLWDAGVRVKEVEKLYSPAPPKIISGVLAAWGLVQGDGKPLAAEVQKAVDSILALAPDP